MWITFYFTFSCTSPSRAIYIHIREHTLIHKHVDTTLLTRFFRRVVIAAVWRLKKQRAAEYGRADNCGWQTTRIQKSVLERAVTVLSRAQFVLAFFRANRSNAVRVYKTILFVFKCRRWGKTITAKKKKMFCFDFRKRSPVCKPRVYV